MTDQFYNVLIPLKVPKVRPWKVSDAYRSQAQDTVKQIIQKIDGDRAQVLKRNFPRNWWKKEFRNVAGVTFDDR